MIDWSQLHTAYGPATAVPAAIALAAELADPIESLDGMLGQAHFVVDSGVLNQGAPSFVELLLEVARSTREQGRAAWPALRVVLDVMESRATSGDSFGLAPGEGPPLFADPRSLDRRLTHERVQSVLHWKIDEIVRERLSLLSSLIATGSSEERAIASAVAILAGGDASAIVPHLQHALRHERNERTRCALMLGWARLAPDAAELRPVVVEGLASGGLLRVGAATAALWTPFAPELDRATLDEGVREAFAHVPPNPLSLTFDYAWHRELIGGEAARAVYACNWAVHEKLSMLAVGLEASPRPITSEYAAPESTPAASAAWFYLRTALRRHYHRWTIIGPEDLDDAERDALRTLWAHRMHWVPFGPYVTERFGVVDFEAVTPRLVGERADSLNRIVRGSWAGREVSWSRWKWLRSSIDQTSYASDGRRAAVAQASVVATSGATVDEIVEIVLCVARERELPLSGVLMQLVSRVTTRHAGADAATAAAADPVDEDSPALSAQSIENRVRVGRLAVAAAVGRASEYRELVQELHGGIGEVLANAIQATARGRGLIAADEDRFE